MKEENNELSVISNTEIQNYTIQEIKNSILIPEALKKNPKDVLIVMDYAKRTNRSSGEVLTAMDYAVKLKVSPLTVLQNLFEINGHIGFSSTFQLSILKTCGLFENIEFIEENSNDLKKWNVTMKAIRTVDKKEVSSVPIYYTMAKKSTDAWIQYPLQMMKYRAVSMFARIHCPELFSLYNEDEVNDLDKKETIVINKNIKE